MKKSRWEQEEDLRQSIGWQIYGARTALGMTVQQLADKCGLTEVDLMDIEAGHADPTIHCLQDIASALDMVIHISFVQNEEEEDEN